jgi:hypothetical protein
MEYADSYTSHFENGCNLREGRQIDVFDADIGGLRGIGLGNYVRNTMILVILDTDME